MKIAHIVCTYPPYYGGMGNVVFQTVSELAKFGHEVAVYTPNYYEEKEIKLADEITEEKHNEDLQNKIDYARRLKPSLSYGNAARLPQLGLELDDFDLVHLHYPFFGTANLVRKWKLKNPNKPLVITYHMDNRSPGWKGLIFKYYNKYWMPKILNSADLLIGSSFDYIENSDARDLFLQNKDKWAELPFGVDIERFQPRKKPLELFERHNLDPNLATLLFVGGMDEAHYFKGVPVLIKALTVLKQNGLYVQTVLVGDGNLKSDFENKARFYGVYDQIKFVGKVSDEDLPKYYNMADLFVLPSTTKGEAFGMVLLEAMSSGVPVITSDLSGVRILGRQGGVVVQPNNHKELSQSIFDFFEVGFSQKDKENLRQIVFENYNWKIIVTKLNDLYNGLL